MSELSDQITAFAQTISSQPLGLATHKPEAESEPTRCFQNVAWKVKNADGRIQFGWIFQTRRATKLDDLQYLIAVHHAVWNSPDGTLVDVTPFHTDPNHHPVAPGGNVLFLIDDQAKPIITDAMVAPLPSLFYPLSQDPRLVGYVQELARQEVEDCRQIYQ